MSNENKRDVKGNISSATMDELDAESEKEDLRKLEAIFFVSGRFLTMQDLVALSDLNPIIIRETLGKLIKKYEEKDSAICIVQKGGEVGEKMWKMDVVPEYSHFVNRLATGSSEFTKAEQETLAIIAFKQPMKQSVLIKIRGNKAYDHIKKFVELGLIRKKKMGHTHELNLSEEFYDYFNLSEGSLSLKEESPSALKEDS